LEEDAEAAKNMNDLRVNDEIVTALPEAVQNTVKSKDIKPILKRKDNEVDAKSEKRVRFQPECKEEEGVPLRNFSNSEISDCEDSCVSQKSSIV
ncbi:hypothetical protein, partial [Clostridium perfringens]|uniref:hypothetical protein n=1 Tax=Clostridium perfringens TaxID=1502 RepID=UPI003755072E